MFAQSFHIFMPMHMSCIYKHTPTCMICSLERTHVGFNMLAYSIRFHICRKYKQKHHTRCLDTLNALCRAYIDCTIQKNISNSKVSSWALRCIASQINRCYDFLLRIRLNAVCLPCYPFYECESRLMVHVYEIR